MWSAIWPLALDGLGGLRKWRIDPYHWDFAAAPLYRSFTDILRIHLIHILHTGSDALRIYIFSTMLFMVIK